jgi:hypothetical protein
MHIDIAHLDSVSPREIGQFVDDLDDEAFSLLYAERSFS